MKYIIDIPDDRIGDFVGSTHLLMPYTMAGHKGHHDTGLALTPYDELDRKAIEDEVWEFATICTKMNGADSVDVFGGFSTDSFTKFSYQEAKDKYEEWLKQKDGIKVGDEVIPTDTQYDTMIVTRTWKDNYWREYIDTVGFDGSICSFLKSNVKKTGRHFPEVAELLEKMREEEE